MILVGNQRGSAANLASHLLSPENEFVHVHAITGFASEDLREALAEAEAVSKGTRCKQFLYSLSLNPPPQESVETTVFEDAIERVENTLGLSAQPKAIVFHEKPGADGQTRRHAHAVWSRINTDEMKAVQISWDRKKLVSMSRELFIEHGWKMPRGLINSKERSMKNFTLAEWQQAKRVGKDPRAIKKAFQDAWVISDSRAAFTQALQERGYKIARGDRRGFVGVDEHGEVYSIPRQAGVNTKDVRLRLGDEDKLPSLAVVKDEIAEEMLPTLDRHQQELEAQKQHKIEELKSCKAALVENQKLERTEFFQRTETHRVEDAQTRQARFRPGIKGLWDRLRGEHERIIVRNTHEAEQALLRDRKEKDQLIAQHLEQRREFAQQRMEARQNYIDQRTELHRDVVTYQQMQLPGKIPQPESNPKQEYIRQRQEERPTQDQLPSQSRERTPTPE